MGAGGRDRKGHASGADGARHDRCDLGGGVARDKAFEHLGTLAKRIRKGSASARLERPDQQFDRILHVLIPARYFRQDAGVDFETRGRILLALVERQNA